MGAIVINGTTIHPKQVVYNGNDLKVLMWSSMPVFSKHVVSISYMSAVYFQTLASGKKYIDFGTIGTTTWTSYVNFLLPNNQVMGDSIDLSSWNGNIISTYFTGVVSGGSNNLYGDLLGYMAVPTTGQTTKSYLIPARSKYIVGLTASKKEWNGSAWAWSSLGTQPQVMYADAPYIQPTGNRLFTLIVHDDSGVPDSETIKFTLTFANTSEITSTSRLGVKYVITRVSGASTIADSTFSIFGKTETLNKNSSSVSGVAEVGSLNGLSTKDISMLVTSAPATDYTDRENYTIALTPFVIS